MFCTLYEGIFKIIDLNALLEQLFRNISTIKDEWRHIKREV